MTSLDRRLEALAEAAELASDRLDDQLVADARRVVEKAGSRLGLGVETTVAALGGPTGAGSRRSSTRWPVRTRRGGPAAADHLDDDVGECGVKSTRRCWGGWTCRDDMSSTATSTTG